MIYALLQPDEGRRRQQFGAGLVSLEFAVCGTIDLSKYVDLYYYRSLMYVSRILDYPLARSSVLSLRSAGSFVVVAPPSSLRRSPQEIRPVSTSSSSSTCERLTDERLISSLQLRRVATKLAS